MSAVCERMAGVCSMREAGWCLQYGRGCLVSAVCERVDVVRSKGEAVWGLQYERSLLFTSDVYDVVECEILGLRRCYLSVICESILIDVHVLL